MLPLKMRSVPRLLLLTIYAAIILWLSLTPSPPSPPGIIGWDKLQHAGAFAVLALLAGWAFAPLSAVSTRVWGWVMALAMACGALIEILQGLLTKTRTAEFGDLAADAVGAGIVCLIMAVRGRSRRFLVQDDAKRNGKRG